MATIAAQEYPVQAPKVENLDDVAHKVEAGVEYWETQDEADMARMGKRQQTRRNFGLLTLIGLTTSMMCTWEAALPFFTTAFINGGSVTMIYGFIFSFLGALATCASLAEMASIYPTSGGQYHWVALLAPPRYSKFSSWLTGWLSAIGWQAGTTTGIFLSGTIIQGLLVLNYPAYHFERWHGTLMAFAVIAVVIVVNTILAKFLPALEGVILILHVLGFFAILIPLVHLAPTSSAQFVFRDFTNRSGYSSDGLSWFIGTVYPAIMLIGYDGACHMAEEVQNASVNVPRSMIGTTVINGALGFAMFIVILFTIGNIKEVLDSRTGWPFIELFRQATGTAAGATAMTSFLIAMYIFASFGFMASASRQTWAFARDRGVPFSSYFARIDKHFVVPVWAIGVSSLISALLSLINIGSSVAYNAIISLLLAGFFSSYLLPIFFLMMRRFRKEPIPWGPWTLGRAGLPINIIAVLYTVLIMVFSFFPPKVPVKPDTMNWSVVVYSGVVIFGVVFYFVKGRRDYNGPVIDRQFRPLS